MSRMSEINCVLDHIPYLKRWYRFILFSGLLLSLVGCSEPIPDEQRIRQRIDAMVQGSHEKSISMVMQPVADEFLGNQQIRKVNLKGLVLLHFRQHKNVHVVLNNLTVELDGNTALVTCNVVLAGRNKTLPERARVLTVTSNWAKQDDEWFVVSASWEDPIMKLL